MKRLSYYLLALMLCFTVPQLSFAKGGGYSSSAGRSSGGYSSSFGRSSSGGYSSSFKSTPSTGSVKSPPSTPSKGYSSSATSNQSKPSSNQSKPSSSYTKAYSAKAMSDYTTQQNSFKYKASPTTTVNNTYITKNVTKVSPQTYATNRASFYSGYTWAPQPYVYHSYNSFGMWDAMYLWFMLDHINDRQYALMYYNHQNDPGMQQFRSELNRLSQDNQDLKAKLANLEVQEAALKAENVKQDPNYMPKGAEEVALKSDLVTEEGTSTLKIVCWVFIGLASLALIFYVILKG